MILRPFLEVVYAGSGVIVTNIRVVFPSRFESHRDKLSSGENTISHGFGIYSFRKTC